MCSIEDLDRALFEKAISSIRVGKVVVLDLESGTFGELGDFEKSSIWRLETTPTGHCMLFRGDEE